jgi:hypothetical protein
MKLHSGYITQHLRSATEEKLLDGVSGYNQGYDTDTPEHYRQIPADILAEIHAVEVEAHKLHDRKVLLLKAGWRKGRPDADLIGMMDQRRHDENHAYLLDR